MKDLWQDLYSSHWDTLCALCQIPSYVYVYHIPLKNISILHSIFIEHPEIKNPLNQVPLSNKVNTYFCYLLLDNVFKTEKRGQTLSRQHYRQKRPWLTE